MHRAIFFKLLFTLSLLALSLITFSQETSFYITIPQSTPMFLIKDKLFYNSRHREVFDYTSNCRQKINKNTQRAKIIGLANISPVNNN